MAAVTLSATYSKSQFAVTEKETLSVRNLKISKNGLVAAWFFWFAFFFHN